LNEYLVGWFNDGIQYIQTNLRLALKKSLPSEKIVIPSLAE
jgi:hypothetical protein